MNQKEISGTWNLLKIKLRRQPVSLTSDEEELLETIQKATGRTRDEIIRLIRELTEPISGSLEEW
jgi:hypothetical protein